MIADALLGSRTDRVAVVETDGTLAEYDGRRRHGAAPVWADSWPEDARPRVEAAVVEALAGRSDRFQAWCTLPNGDRRFWDVAVSPMIGDDGRVDRILAVSRDATAIAAGTGRRDPQSERGRVIDEFAGLGTDHDPLLDQTTAAAAAFFGVKTAVISIVEKDCFWFKSTCNFDGTTVDRDVALCEHTIRTPGGVMVVEDAAADSRFADNPAVTASGGIRFYAGATLTTPDGVPFGVLCLIDSAPRRFSDREEKALSLFAANAVTRIQVIQRDRQLGDSRVALREMKHRISNTYAQVSALVRMTAKTAEDKDALTHRLSERIAMLSRAQAHILASDYEAADVEGLLGQVLGEDPRIAIEVRRNVMLTDQATFLLALLISELVSNARKYGALSDADGTVRVTVSGEERFVFEWEERADVIEAAAAPEAGRGFGTRILTDLVPRSLGGQSGLTCEKGTLAYRLDAPIDRIAHARLTKSAVLKNR